MTRLPGSRNRPKYVQEDLPEMPERPAEVCEPENQTQEKENTMEKINEVKHVVRTISRSDRLTYNEKGELQAVSMTETEKYINQLLSTGWNLFHVEVLSQDKVTFDMLYVLTK